MDPLVRLAQGIRSALGRSAGLAISVGLSGYLVARHAGLLSELWDLAAVVTLLSSLLLRVVKRSRAGGTAETGRLDLEISTQSLVLAYGLLLHVTGGLSSAWHGCIYWVLMIVAAFTRTAVTFVTIAFCLLLELGFESVVDSPDLVARLVPHAILSTVFASANLVIFRAEIARVRHSSRAQVEAELERVKEQARSYRLVVSQSSATESRHQPRSEDERTAHSAVEEIRSALSFALDLLSRNLELKTAALFWLDATGHKLHLQELLTRDESILAGPFFAKDGVFGAALSQLKPVSVAGAKVGRQLPYRDELASPLSVCAVPVVDQGNKKGILLVERAEKRPFTADDESLLQATTRFVLRVVENERMFVQLERAKVEQGKLYRAVDKLAASSTESEVIDAAVSSAREFAAFDTAIVTLLDSSGQRHEICAASGEGTETLVGRSFGNNASLVAMAVANRHALPHRGDYDPIRHLVFAKGIELPPLPSVLVLPLMVHERALGTLVLGSRRKGAFAGAVRTILEVLASHLAVSLSNARMMRRLEDLATLDGLTGLLNKRALLESAALKIRSASRFGKTLSVLICDIDHFKKVNDTYGHDIGDVVIRGFADVLRRNKRDVDVLGRFGGEEFVIVCEETGEKGATQLGERIRAELETASFATEKGLLQVTCSVGVTTFPTGGQDWDSLFKSADEALYVSKRGGRNRVTHAAAKRVSKAS